MTLRDYSTEGLPFPPRVKLMLVSTLFIIFLINQSLALFQATNYPFRGVVSIMIIGLIVIFSLGDKKSEYAVMSLSFIFIGAGIYAIAIQDTNLTELGYMLIAIIVFIIEVIFGKVSIMNAIKFTRRQFR